VDCTLNLLKYKICQVDCLQLWLLDIEIKLKQKKEDEKNLMSLVSVYALYESVALNNSFYWKRKNDETKHAVYMGIFVSRNVGVDWNLFCRSHHLSSLAQHSSLLQERVFTCSFYFVFFAFWVRCRESNHWVKA